MPGLSQLSESVLKRELHAVVDDAAHLGSLPTAGAREQQLAPADDAALQEASDIIVEVRQIALGTR